MNIGKKSKTANPVSVSCRQMLQEMFLIDTFSLLLIFLGICRARSTLPPLNPNDKRSKITFSDFTAFAASSVRLASERVRVVGLPNLVFKFICAHSDPLGKSRGVSIELSRLLFGQISGLLLLVSLGLTKVWLSFEILPATSDEHSSSVIRRNSLVLPFDGMAYF